MMFLEGLRVLDLSRILAGPICTQILGDMGADVLKIERPGVGDDTRTWGPPFQGPMSAYFQSCNRNKASLVLDLKAEADFQKFAKLVRCADVLVDNLLPATANKLGLDSDRIAALNPQIVQLNISGYRRGTSRENHAGYDLILQAESGLMGITGPVDGPGYKVGVALVDVLCGMMGANGILAALYARRERSVGAQLHINLHQTALFSLVNVSANYLVSGKPSARHGNAHANIVPYQDFKCADRQIVIGVGNDSQYQKLCRFLKLEDPELCSLTNPERIAYRDKVVAAIAAKLNSQPSDQVLQSLAQLGIPAAPILAPHEAIRAAQRFNPGTLTAMTHADLGEVSGLANPLEGWGMRSSHTAPPLLDQGGSQMAACWLQDKSG